MKVSVEAGLVSSLVFCIRLVEVLAFFEEWPLLLFQSCQEDGGIGQKAE